MQQMEPVKASEVRRGDLLYLTDPGILLEIMRHRRVRAVSTHGRWTTISFRGGVKASGMTLGKNQQLTRVIETVWAVTVSFDAISRDRTGATRSFLIKAADKETAQELAIKAAHRDGYEGRCFASAVKAADKYQRTFSPTGN